MSDDRILIASPSGNPADDRLIDPDVDLLRDLTEAENENTHRRPCQICQAMAGMSESVRANVERALAGTIGEKKLADILTRNGYPAGRRAIQRHQLEGHPS